MKLIRFSLAIALLVTFDTGSAFAQVDYGFGVITPEEAALTDCAFDPGADAVVLIDKGLSDHRGDLNGLTTYRHTRIKILKKEAIADMNFKLMYISADNLEDVEDIKAAVINFDENKNKVIKYIDKKAIYRRKKNEHATEISFAFPELVVGSIVELSYTFIAKHWGRLKDWEFQGYYPVYKSTYEIKMIPHLEMRYDVQRNPAYPVIVKPKEITNSVYFEMNNLPGLKDEPFMASRRENLQMVKFATVRNATRSGTFISTWEDMTKKLYGWDDFGAQIKAKASASDNFVSSFSGKSDTEKMNLIYNYVRKNIKWNESYGLFSDKGVRETWTSKAGSSGSINLLLINMLRNAGLKVRPMMVCERGFGKVNKTKPSLRQFNNVFAVVTIDGKGYYLDATNEYNPSYLTPFSILHTTAFIADPDSGGLKDIEASDDYKYKDIITIQATLADDKTLKGSVNIKSFDYSKNIKAKAYDKDKPGYAEERYSKPYNAQLEKFNVGEIAKETDPFTESFDFKKPIDEAGDYWVLPMNIFSGLNENPFIAEKRLSEVDFGYKKTVILNYVINLPATKSAGELLKNVQLVNSDKSLTFSRTVSYFENTHQLTIRIKIRTAKGLLWCG